MQLPVSTPLRPNYHTMDNAAVIEELTKEICQWDTTLYEEEVKIDVQKIIMFTSSTSDGYELAKEFERKGYNPDVSLVEILDSAYSLQMSCLTNAEKQWVIDNDIKPKYQEEQVVYVEVRDYKGNGVISKVDGDTAKYTVRIEALGHVKEGLGTHGFILPFELVEAWQQPPVYQAQQ